MALKRRQTSLPWSPGAPGLPRRPSAAHPHQARPRDPVCAQAVRQVPRIPGTDLAGLFGGELEEEGKGCPLQESAPGGRWANPDHNWVCSRRVCWLGARSGLASLATGWGVGHLRWGKSSQGNQLIHSRLKAVRPASRGERIALPGAGWVRPGKRVRRSGSAP